MKFEQQLLRPLTTQYNIDKLGNSYEFRKNKYIVKLLTK